MRSHGKGSLSAATQVKVLSPEILHIALGQGFHDLEARISTRAKGECVTDVPGSESAAGKRTVYIGTWEGRSVPDGSFRGAEEVTREYGVSVFGLTHSRGVNRVMPVEDLYPLEGVSDSMQRGEFGNAIH
jgi:hypothetical protein